MSKIGYIYCLKDPRTDEIRYVGQTINDPKKRMAQHIHQEKRTTGKLTHVNSWIRNLKQSNLCPIMEILEECVVEELNNKEIYFPIPIHIALSINSKYFTPIQGIYSISILSLDLSISLYTNLLNLYILYFL